LACKVVGRIDWRLIAGSHLPDLVPFVPGSVFSFEEIHESGDRFLKFLDKNYPEKRDLALGMMTHSVKFGADRFNREIEQWLLGNDERARGELVKKITACSGVVRIHNYLWAGLDVYLLKKHFQTVKKIAKVHSEIDQKEIADLLVAWSGKDRSEVKRMIDYFFTPLRPPLFTSLPGLVEIWKGALAGLPEKDEVDEEKTILLFEEIYKDYQGEWGAILEKVTNKVKENLAVFV